MPAITTPAGLPCPQDMGTSIVDTRLQNAEGGKGPIEYRAIERDERQMQSLAWTLNEEQAAIFRDWWTETLVYGGAWFSAPDNWPAMDGRVAKVRRFTTAPQWRALGAGFWHVSIGAELRGETLLPNEPEPEEPPPDGNGATVTLRPNLEDMEYASVYNASLPGVLGVGGTFDPGLCGMGITLSNGNLTALLMNGEMSSGSCRGTELRTDEDICFELVIEAMNFEIPVWYQFGMRVHTGLGSFDPEARLNEPIANNSSNYCQTTSLGGHEAFFYGATEDIAILETGDVLGFVYRSDIGETNIYKNGALIVSGPTGNNVVGVAVGFLMLA